MANTVLYLYMVIGCELTFIQPEQDFSMYLFLVRLCNHMYAL